MYIDYYYLCYQYQYRIRNNNSNSNHFYNDEPVKKINFFDIVSLKYFCMKNDIDKIYELINKNEKLFIFIDSKYKDNEKLFKLCKNRAELFPYFSKRLKSNLKLVYDYYLLHEKYHYKIIYNLDDEIKNKLLKDSNNDTVLSLFNILLEKENLEDTVKIKKTEKVKKKKL